MTRLPLPVITYNEPPSNPEEKCQSSPNAIPPFGIRVQQLLLEIDLDTNSIQEDKFSEISPWTLERAGSILDLAALHKDKTPPEVYREKFEQIIDNHSDHYLLFTDGSKDEACVGAACHSSSADKCCGVNAKASIITVEAVALCMALDTVSTLRKDKFLILSDSLSLVKAVGEATPRNPRILKVLERIHEIQTGGKRIVLCWIPSHVGIEGNEMADELAKIGLEPTQLQIPASDAKPIIQTFMRETGNAMEQYDNQQIALCPTTF
ncbi:hypothetical protein EGW08_008870 [Elysia chlorotica]|uniref:RNase H type-1 domain-containing protein n=1 Tax=Elysia chlorotica TaxID=188477 RepID=A0A3S1BGE8_ELYCH|nr:hypothetical protein EGW08_008870 [Elysia chlorotica]